MTGWVEYSSFWTCRAECSIFRQAEQIENFGYSVVAVLVRQIRLRNFGSFGGSDCEIK